MIESNILGAAVGIQNQGVIDKTEGTSLPSTGNAVIVGKFKRGRMDKAFVVTKDNYKALLGHDPSNASYQAVEDVFNRGVSQVSVRRVGTPGKAGGASGSDGGSNTPEMSFLKLISEIIEVTSDFNAGIVYKLNNQPIRASIRESAENVYASSAVTSTTMTGNGDDLTFLFLAYETDLFGNGTPTPPVPLPLDSNFAYIFGINDKIFTDFSVAAGQLLLDGFTDNKGEFVITLYPASKLPSANIDQDLFDYIVDPAKYTQADLQYFAEQGVTPAIKNPDGSYTINSQLMLPQEY